MPPFDSDKLVHLMEQANLDALMATTRHNVRFDLSFLRTVPGLAIAIVKDGKVEGVDPSTCLAHNMSRIISRENNLDAIARG